MRTIALATLLACGSPATEDSPMPKHVRTPPSFEAGPEIGPADELRAWFKASESATVRVPVVIERRADGLGGVQSAWVGASAEPAPADALQLTLDDTTMGISLADQLRNLCPEDGRCVVWIEGRWGAALDPQATDVITVRAVRGDVPADARLGVEG